MTALGKEEAMSERPHRGRFPNGSIWQDCVEKLALAMLLKY
jgi:hypothetical protein